MDGFLYINIGIGKAGSTTYAAQTVSSSPPQKKRQTKKSVTTQQTHLTHSPKSSTKRK